MGSGKGKLAAKNGFDPLVPENWYKIKQDTISKMKVERKRERRGRERNREEKEEEREPQLIFLSIADLVGQSQPSYHYDSERVKKRKRKEEGGPSAVCPTVVHRTASSRVAQSQSKIRIKSLNDIGM